MLETLNSENKVPYALFHNAVLGIEIVNSPGCDGGHVRTKASL